MGARFLIEIGRWIVRVGLILMLGASLPGMGSVARLEAAKNAECVLTAEGFQLPRLGTEPFQLQDILTFGTDDVWVTGQYGAGSHRKDFLLHWNGLEWIDVAPNVEMNGGNARRTGLTLDPRKTGTERTPENLWGNGRSLLGGTSATDVWHVSETGAAMHWDGATWAVDLGFPSGFYSSMYARSKKDIWLTASEDASPNQTVFTHWDGVVWKRVNGPLLSDTVHLWDVKALSRKNAWAVGGVGQNKNSLALILLWDGKDWVQVASPKKRGMQLFALAVIEKNDIWAVGWGYKKGTKRPLTMHWNGTKWKIVKTDYETTPKQIAGLTSVTAISTDNVWAVGDVGNKNLVLHWDGQRWGNVENATAPDRFGKIVAAGDHQLWAASEHALVVGNGRHWEDTNLPWFGYNTGELNRMHAFAPDDIWVAGEVLEHWDGNSWQVVTLPEVWDDPITFKAIYGRAPNELWVLAEGPDNIYDDPFFVLYWDGQAWTRVTDAYNSGRNGIFDMAVIASDDIWLSGFAYAGASTDLLIQHWDGNAWTRVTLPEGVNSMNRSLGRMYARAANDIWVVGTTMLHWDGATWSILTEEDTQALGFVGESDIWAAGVNEFWHYDGSAWTSFPDGINQQYAGFAIFAPDDIYALGHSPVIEHWDGVAWQPVDSIADVARTRDVVMTAENEFWTVGTEAGFGNSVVRRFTRTCE